MNRRPLLLLACAGVVASVLALTALAGGRFTSYTGGVGSLTTPPGRWWTLWAVPPFEVVAIVAGSLAVAWWLRGRGQLNARAVWMLVAAAVVLLMGVCSPLAGLAQGGILSAHMAQHTLIGALAPVPFVLAFPRRRPEQDEQPAPWLRVLGHPAVAFGIWVVTTAVWLQPQLHHEVVVHESLWVAQQFAFFGAGVLLWLPILERGVSSPRWFGTAAKCGYMVGVWFVGVIIGNIYWFSGTAFYESHAVASRVWGLDPMSDQANAGSVMFGAHCMITLAAMTWLFFRQSRESSLAQRLRDAGVAHETVEQAIRRGELSELAVAHGVRLEVRAGID